MMLLCKLTNGICGAAPRRASADCKEYHVIFVARMRSAGISDLLMRKKITGLPQI